MLPASAGRIIRPWWLWGHSRNLGGGSGDGGNWWADDATTTNNPTCAFIFTGRRWDPETQIYFYRARYYSPPLGRFLSRDPIGYTDAMGLYEYVESNPVEYTDAFGLYFKWSSCPCGDFIHAAEIWMDQSDAMVTVFRLREATLGSGQAAGQYVKSLQRLGAQLARSIAAGKRWRGNLGLTIKNTEYLQRMYQGIGFSTARGAAVGVATEVGSQFVKRTTPKMVARMLPRFAAMGVPFVWGPQLVGTTVRIASKASPYLLAMAVGATVSHEMYIDPKLGELRAACELLLAREEAIAISKRLQQQQANVRASKARALGLLRECKQAWGEPSRTTALLLAKRLGW